MKLPYFLKLNQRGYDPRVFMGGIICIIILGLLYPTLTSFLSIGITATGGVTAILLTLIPFVMAAAVAMRIWQGKNAEPPAPPY
jgi:heme/copper-type cytochrome/quinol oxidase subunit 4